MIAFPNCKINLGLHITEKRQDGYHNLQTIFYPVPWCDIVEIINLKSSIYNQKNDSSDFRFQIEDSRFKASGIPVPGDPRKNLCIRAWELLKKDYPQLPSVYIHLHKIIPMGAGLGGGSSDGACVLKTLNEQFTLNLNAEQINRYALALGSDCPFFMENKPSYATGRGEILEPVALDLSNYKIVFINAGIHISTKWAFENIQPQQPQKDLREVIALPITEWKHTLCNDFEAPVIAANPQIGEIKEALYADGALYTSMTGSGSTIFGIYPKYQSINLNFPSTYLVKTV